MVLTKKRCVISVFPHWRKERQARSYSERLSGRRMSTALAPVPGEIIPRIAFWSSSAYLESTQIKYLSVCCQ